MPFVGVAQVALFWDRNTLALMSTLVINFAFKEIAYMAMNRSMRDIVHCFECLGDFIKAWRFPFHQLVDGTFDFSQTD